MSEPAPIANPANNNVPVRAGVGFSSSCHIILLLCIVPRICQSIGHETGPEVESHRHHSDVNSVAYCAGDSGVQVLLIKHSREIFLHIDLR